MPAPGRPPARGAVRVALFCETFLPKIDGVVTRLVRTVEHLRRQGHEALVVVPAGGPDRIEGAEVLGVPALPVPLYPELKIGIPVPRIGRALERFRPDVIHVMHPMAVGLAGLFYAKVMRRSLVVSYHTHLARIVGFYGLGPLEPALGLLTRILHNRADLSLCPSTAMMETLAGWKVQRLGVWPFGVDAELFAPHRASPEMRRALGGDPAAPLLLYVGRLSAEKEIERIRDVLEALPGLRLALVGDGPHRAQLERHFEGTETHFAGWLRGEALAAAFASADALVLPSRTETLGFVLLEAMASGCPVIAIAAGGIPDAVADGVTGLLYPPDDDAGLVAAARRLFGDGCLRRDLARRARAAAVRSSWSAATRELVDLYRGVISERRGCGATASGRGGSAPRADGP